MSIIKEKVKLDEILKFLFSTSKKVLVNKKEDVPIVTTAIIQS